MRNFEVEKNTSNRGEFNRVYKLQLEKKGKIRCSYCKYNRGENKTSNNYGGFDGKVKYPSWKLVSKNRKQWMKKPIKVRREKLKWSKRMYTYIDF